MKKPQRITHQMRKDRRQEFVKEYRKSKDIDAVARKFKIGTEELRRSLRREGVELAPANNRYEIRRKIAEEVRRTGDPAAVAKKYQVTPAYVSYQCCKEFGVKVKRPTPQGVVGGVTLRVIADLLKGERQTHLAEKYNVTAQWISWVYQRAIAAGILPPSTRKKSERKTPPKKKTAAKGRAGRKK